MLLRTLIYSLFLTLSLAAEAALEVLKEQPVTQAQSLTFKSKLLTNPPKVDVYLPSDYHQTSEQVHYPLILTLDGWALSQTVSGVVSHLGNTASMPKAIVVAINSNDEYAWGPEIFVSQSGWNDSKDTRLDGFSGGEANKYLTFLEQELLPLLDTRYRTNDFRILIGMSPSAAFALHTLWKAPNLFDAHFVFAASDVIGMGYTPDSTFIDKIATSLAKEPNRKGYLYVASAQREADKNPARQKNVDALIQALTPYTNRNFKLKAEHIPNFGHYPMALPGLLNALDLVFPREKFGMSGKFSEFLKTDAPFENLIAYYETLSKNVGFKVYPNPDLRRNSASLRVAGYRLRNKGKYDEAEKVYRLWLEISPNSIKAKYGLGMVYAEKGVNHIAIQHFEDALQLATQHQSPLLGLIQGKLSEVKAAN